MSKDGRINILFTSVGRRSYLVEYFKTALEGKGLVHVANSSGDTPAFRVADKSVITPIIYSDEYIDFLLKYCKDNEIGCIISLFDIDLPVLAKNKIRFEQIGTKVLVSEEEVINICNDKYQTYCSLKKVGFNVPKTYLRIEDVKRAILNGELTYPVIVKPRWGMGSIGIYEADSPLELEVLYNKLNNDIKKTYLKYESEADNDNKIIIQEKLTGLEYGLDIINDLDGNYKTTSCKLKYAMRAGETDCAVTVESEVLTELGMRLGKTLKHICNLDVDVIVKEDVPYILEMNARFGGGFPFSYLGGVNLPLAIVSWLRGEAELSGCLDVKYNIKGHKDIRIVEL